MAFYTAPDGTPLYCGTYTKVAASQTTAQISASGNANERGDYLAGVLVTWASTLTGTVNVLDGTTSLALIPSPVTGATDITPPVCRVWCGCPIYYGLRHHHRLICLLHCHRQI
jgi:hypothetical protein